MMILLSLNIIPGFKDSILIMGLSCTFTILFLGYTISMIIAALFRQRSITGDIIFASLCGYLLIGLCWTFVYSLIEIILPGSFSISEAHKEISSALNVTGDQSGFALYYSFVTLTTLGFGDVIPINPISRAFSYGEAAIGQLYLAVLVARLVGLHISQSFVEKNKLK